jgi:predicted LPLAT superfamily acyltransferase
MAAHPSVKTSAAWRRAPEVGTALGIRFVVAVAKILGRTAATAFLWFLALYYVLASRRVRIHSRRYLSRIGQPPTFANVHRHVHTFARVTLDRLFFLRGELDQFRVTKHGDDKLLALTVRKQGALLLGSHLGSFEAMRAVGRDEGLKLSIVVDNRNAERLAGVLRELGNDDIDVIAVDPNGIGTALRIRDAIGRGELVGIMVDRALPRDERNVVVDFLGAPAPLPSGAFLLAHTLRCPVYQVFGLFHPPNHYDLHCEHFADRVELDRDARAEALARHAQRFADRLAEHARRAPYNWFNFFDFWQES